jgi:hypothetical protein
MYYKYQNVIKWQMALQIIKLIIIYYYTMYIFLWFKSNKVSGKNPSLEKEIIVCYFIIKKTLSDTTKPAHVVTSIKESPVLKGYLFLSCQKILYELNLF